MFPISSYEISLCKMYSIGIVSDCMSRKIIRSTPNRNNLFGRKMRSSLNYLFIRLTDVIVRNKHRELQLLLKLENGDFRCNQYIAWLLESTSPRSLKNSLFFISQKCCYICLFLPTSKTVSNIRHAARGFVNLYLRF